MSALPRRSFLSGLASLPLVGGGITLVGQPTGAALPVTTDLLMSYKSWLHYEHSMLSFELAGHDRSAFEQVERFFDCTVPGDSWHFRWRGRGLAGWIDAPQPSTRAAVILSAAGVPLTEGDA